MFFYHIDCDTLLKVKLFNEEHIIPPEKHITRYTPEYILYIIIKGELCINNDGKEYSLKAGDGIIFEKGVYQYAIKSTECQYYYLHLCGDNISKMQFNDDEFVSYMNNRKIEFLKSNVYDTKIYDISSIILPEQFTLDEGYKKIIEGECKKSFINDNLMKKINYKIDISCNVMKMLSALSIKLCEDIFEKYEFINSKDCDLIKQIINYIDLNVSKKISREDISDLFYINYDYANRIFKRLTGVNIFEYKRLGQINLAKKLLLTKNMTISMVAKECGYSDVYGFSHAFKRTVGISPKQYSLEYTLIVASENKIRVI